MLIYFSSGAMCKVSREQSRRNFICRVEITSGAAYVGADRNYPEVVRCLLLLIINLVFNIH